MDFARHEQAFIEDVLLWVSSMGMCEIVTHSYLTRLAHGFDAACNGGFF